MIYKANVLLPYNEVPGQPFFQNAKLIRSRVGRAVFSVPINSFPLTRAFFLFTV